MGGKRFRPRMVLTAYESLGGTDTQAAAYIGAAFELLHTALIVHDDVIDHDFTRRGAPNISGTYRDRAAAAGSSEKVAEHSGISAAVIAGDLALFNSYRLIDRSGVSDVVRARLLEVMDDALFASAAGELIDVDFSIAPDMPRVDDILIMERLKTAVYSFECPLQAGRDPRRRIGGGRVDPRRVRPRDRHRVPDRRRPARGLRHRGGDRQDHARRPSRGQAHRAGLVRDEHPRVGEHRPPGRRPRPDRRARPTTSARCWSSAARGRSPKDSPATTATGRSHAWPSRTSRRHSAPSCTRSRTPCSAG